MAEAAVAVNAAHRAGLVHCDVKPSNILIDATTGRAKITDFGVARALAAPSTITREGMVAGTPAYMSPEQARGDSKLDLRTDVYSLGATFYEGLTGQPPFTGALHAILGRIVDEDPIAPRRLDPEIPADLETICLKAMAKEPASRYQTAIEIADDLRRWQRAEPIEARPAGHLEHVWYWCRRKPLVAGLALALLVVIIGGVAGISWKWAEAVSERNRTERERQRAVRNFRHAREAVDTYLTQVSENDVLKRKTSSRCATSCCERPAISTSVLLRKIPTTPISRQSWAGPTLRLGLITTVLQSRPESLEHFRKMGAIFSRLHERYPDNPVFQQELAESELRQGESLRSSGPPAQAEAAYQRSRMLQEALVRAHPEEPAYRHDLARSLRSLGNYYIFLCDEYGKAEEVLLAAREAHRGLAGDYARRPAVVFDHARVLLNLAKLYARTHRPQEERAAAEAAIALFEPLTRSHPGDPDYLSNLTDSLTELGESYRSLGEVEPLRDDLEEGARFGSTTHAIPSRGCPPSPSGRRYFLYACVTRLS